MKQDQLRADGKCFDCEEYGHTQRNCPRLHSMQRPTVNAANVEPVRQEWLVKVCDSPDVRVNLVTFDLEGKEDDATNVIHLAYALCVNGWGWMCCGITSGRAPTVVMESMSMIQGQGSSWKYWIKTNRRWSDLKWILAGSWT